MGLVLSSNLWKNHYLSPEVGKEVGRKHIKELPDYRYGINRNRLTKNITNIS